MLALVKLIKKRGKKEFTFLDYVSVDIARLGVQVQGENHSKDEWSNIEVLRVFDNDKK